MKYGIQISKNQWLKLLCNEESIISFDTRLEAEIYAENLELSIFKVKKIK